ncbi:hypothetical protein GCK72_021677 [Caenorhabditis remanei]|uniref:DUF7154 domain-containing protein n=2 Tax=Caenorhabditis remanei TaxID=31234 RepID=A0A6A5GIT5_CAERE|nr:hypothetical protein GCK72_021677 [Caenorhabditis remanei]KAF1755108.1 hypothetical protein GCK72_021677 [Caenorhabditis remanei]
MPGLPKDSLFDVIAGSEVTRDTESSRKAILVYQNVGFEEEESELQSFQLSTSGTARASTSSRESPILESIGQIETLQIQSRQPDTASELSPSIPNQVPNTVEGSRTTGSTIVSREVPRTQTNLNSIRVIVSETSPETEFEPANKQRHFGILHYIVNNRFRKMMLIGFLNLLIFVIFFASIFLFFYIQSQSENREEVSTKPFSTSTSPDVIGDTTTRTDTTAHSHSSDTTTNPFGEFLSVSKDIVLSDFLDRTDCSPNQKSTFFFAYSNDLTADQVLNTWKSISENPTFIFETYALTRFDMMDSSSDSVSSFDSSHSISNLPNPADSFKDPSRGGTVLGIIDSFFCCDVTHCGATLFILTKRLPTETPSYVDYIVNKLKKYHAYATFVVSENSFGGLSPESMYRVASETNGLCIFTEDDRIQETPTWVPSSWPSYLVYSFNAKVTNSGNVTLPIFNSPQVGNYYICMTLQDHGSLDTFRMVHLTWYNEGSSNSGSFEETVESHTDFGNTTYTNKGPYTLDAVPYNLTLQYEFLGETTEVLQIRIYSVQAVDFWVPYNN